MIARVLHSIQPRSIQSKIVLWTGLCLLLVATITVAYAARELHTATMALAEERAIAAAEQNALRIDEAFEEALHTARSLAHTMAAVKSEDNPLDLSREQVNNLLRQTLSTNPHFVGVYTRWEPQALDGEKMQFVDAAGHDRMGQFMPYWYRDARGQIRVTALTELKDADTYYQCPRQTRQECIIEPTPTSLPGTSGFITSLVVPIIVDGQFCGVIGIDLQLTFLQTLADTVDIYDGAGTLALISHQGTLAAVTRQPELIGQAAGVLQAGFETNDERSRHQQGPLIIAYEEVEQAIEIFVPIQVGHTATPWSASVMVPMAVVNAEVAARVGRFVGIGAIMTAGVLVLLWFVAGQIARPIKQVTLIAGEVARGNLDVIAPVASKDETGMLAGVFNQMTANLRQMREVEHAAREALRLSEERYREFVEGTDDLVTQVDQEGYLTYVNHTAERIFGLPATECIGRSAFDFVHPDDRERTRSAFARWLQNRETSITFENRQISRAGDVHHMLWTTNLHYDSAGTITLINSIARDITNLRRAEEALRESQSLLQGLLDNAPAGIYVKDTQGRFLLVNREFASWLQLNAWQMIGRPQEEFFSSELVAVWCAQEQRVITTGDALQIEELMCYDEGLPHTYLTTKFPLYDAQGTVYAIGGVCTDITERKHLEDMLERRVHERTAELIQTNRALQAEIVERQRAEAALWESQALLRGFLDYSPAVMYAKDTYGRYLLVNDRMASLINVPAGQMLGKTEEDLFPAEIVMGIRPNDQWVLVTGKPIKTEEVMPLADGLHTYLAVKFPIANEHGKILAVGGILTDITERKRAEAALWESERRYRRLTENAPDIIYRIQLQPQRQFEYVSPAATVVTGYTPEEHYADADLGFKLIHPDDRQILAALFQGEIPFGDPLELRWVRKDGTLIWIEQQNVPIYDRIGTLVAIEGIARDITARKQAEEVRAATYHELEQLSQQLRRNHDLLQMIFDSINDGLLLIDHAGCVLAANQTMLRLLDCAGDDLVNQSWETFCRRDRSDLQADSCGFPGLWVLETLHDGTPHRQRARFAHNGNAPRVLDMQALPIYSPNRLAPSAHQVEQVVLHVVDVTEQLQIDALMLENERFAANRQLTQIIAHEVNSPLQAIMFSLDMLRRKTSDTEQRTFLAVAQEEIERVGTILHQLKDVYRDTPDAPITVDVNALLERGLLLTAGKLTKYRILVERKLAAAPPEVAIRPDQLMQVLLNLILNAIDAMPDGGTLRLVTGTSITERGTMVVIEISDTGVGIDSGVQPHIFDAFFTTKEHGTGLGLSVSQKIIREAHGTITVSSAPCIGTTFRIDLPVHGVPEP